MIPTITTETPSGVMRLIDYVRKHKPKKLRDGFTFKPSKAIRIKKILI